MPAVCNLAGGVVQMSSCVPGAARLTRSAGSREACLPGTGTETAIRIGRQTSGGAPAIGTGSATVAMLKSMTGTGTGEMARASVAGPARA
jgi:hypothetical protein